MSDNGTDTTEWISKTTAAQRTGLPLPTIQYALRVDRIRRRPVRGPRPTLEARSVDDWAAWYRAGQEVSHPPGDWLSTTDAAAQLDVGPATLYRYTELGRLEVRRTPRHLWVSQESVRRLLEEERRWIFTDEAAEILGCPKHVVARLVDQGHIERRPVARVTPSLLRSSVEAYAPVLAAKQAQVAQRRHQAQQQREAARLAVAPPQDGQVWLTVATTAVLMEMPAKSVFYRIHAGLLPATKRGSRWWLRRVDVEQAAAARVFAHRMDALSLEH